MDGFWLFGHRIWGKMLDMEQNFFTPKVRSDMSISGIHYVSCFTHYNKKKKIVIHYLLRNTLQKCEKLSWRVETATGSCAFCNQLWHVDNMTIKDGLLRNFSSITQPHALRFYDLLLWNIKLYMFYNIVFFYYYCPYYKNGNHLVSSIM